MKADGDSSAAFWAWSIHVYGRPDVKEACHILQDAHGADVNLCLWAIWLGTLARELDPPLAAHALALSATRQSQVIRPLREHRRNLKHELSTEPEPSRRQMLADLRRKLAEAELAAERLEQHDLAALAVGREANPTGTDLPYRNLSLVVPVGAEPTARRLAVAALAVGSGSHT